MLHRCLTILLVSLAGCAADAPRPKVRDSAYYPLEVGSTWKYEGSGDQRITTVTKHTILEGSPCAVVETRQGGTLIDRVHLMAKKEGIFALAIGDRILTKPLPFLRLPAYEGRTWKVNFRDQGQSTVYSIGKEQNVTVPFGTFDTVTLRTEIFEGGAPKQRRIYWFAQKVGVIKQVIETAEEAIEYELMEFTAGE